jgi:hypothetical protein
MTEMTEMSCFAFISYITAIGFGLLSVISSLLTPFLFLFQLCGVRYYIIRRDDEKTRAISKILQNTTMNSITLFQSGNFHPYGYFVNWKCAGFYNYTNSYDNISAEIHILTTVKYFNSLFETDKVSVSFALNKKITDVSTATEEAVITAPIQSINIYSRFGSYTSIFYSRIRIDVQHLEPCGQQGEIVDSICKTFSEKRRGVFFIHGISGAGKSTIGLLVATRLKGTFCHTFNPTEPGDTLPILLRETEPSTDKPTIILIEEINTFIRVLHNETIPRHKNITTCIRNKSTYNTFMDDLFLYQNVMIIMTSNESKDTIDALDPCYLRKGRVDEYYSMMDVITT